MFVEIQVSSFKLLYLVTHTFFFLQRMSVHQTKTVEITKAVRRVTAPSVPQLRTSACVYTHAQETPIVIGTLVPRAAICSARQFMVPPKRVHVRLLAHRMLIVTHTHV